MQHVWKFFASVRLAIFLLAALALTSIIGTVIPQHQPAAFYAERYSPEAAAFFQVLDIPSMYGSWWFVGLLALLALNLIVCSLDRLPKVWQIMGADPAAMPVERIEKMPERANWSNIGGAALPALRRLLTARGFKAANESFFIAEKGAWSRLGAYIVHLSILIIFVGALVGQRYGFKGSLMLPEGNANATDVVFLNQTREPRPLGFTLRCDSFAIAYYDNGMPKKYLSRLTILDEGGKPVLSRDIEVNQPLRYKGITFYQASYQPYDDFIVEFTKNGDPQGERHAFTLPFRQEEEWREEDVKFGVINADGHGQRLERLKLWLQKGDGAPVTLQLAAGEEADFDPYKVRARQLYATGLQVAKDPGVPLVYFGCGLLIFGLYVAFFLAHRRLFALLRQTEIGHDLLLAGTCNKNHLGFARDFAALKAEIEKMLAA